LSFLFPPFLFFLKFTIKKGQKLVARCEYTG
jgi:hypothetical protein